MYFTVYAPLGVIDVVSVPVSVTIRVSASFSVLLLVPFYVSLPAPVQIPAFFSVPLFMFLCTLGPVVRHRVQMHPPPPPSHQEKIK